MRKTVDLGLAYRLLNHGPVTLVSSAHHDARNVMAAAWAMPLDFDPPKVAVVIDAKNVSALPSAQMPGAQNISGHLNTQMAVTRAFRKESLRL